jgi:hypothetical protein
MLSALLLFAGLSLRRGVSARAARSTAEIASSGTAIKTYRPEAQAGTEAGPT